MHLVNITAYGCSFIFFLLIFVIYFSKKNMNNIENSIYRRLLIWDILLVVLCFIYYFCGGLFWSDNQFIRHFICNLYQYTCNVWAYLMLLYTIVISFGNNDKVQKFINKNCRKIYWLTYILNSILCFIFLLFPSITLYDESGMIIAEQGIMVDILNIVNYIPVILLFLIFFIRIKNIEFKKKMPFLVGIIFFILHTFILLSSYPMNLSPVLFTVITALMYFTIENPDVQLIAELTLARDQAMKSNQAKSDFLSSMSHELRTPLNAILGLSQVMKDNDNVDELHKDLDDIILSSEKLLGLVDGILNINSLDNNDIVINNSNYNLKEVLNGLEEVVKLRIGNKNITYRQRISDDLPNMLYGDKEKVRTIINNLLTNAVKYTEEGLIELDISSFIVKDKCNLKISVSDTGQGIKEEDINNIFDKFYRSEENKDSDIEGTGLGLSITKSIIDLMDGKITVNSNYGEGSTFTITLSQKVVDLNNALTDPEIL